MMRLAIVFALCLTLVAGLAVAREATFRPADAQTLEMMRSEDADCIVGNSIDNFIGGYNGWWYGFEDYAHEVRNLHSPMICGCEEGWALRNVTFVIGLDVDTDILVQPALHAAGAAGPGAELYAGPVYNITDIPELNYYTITLDFDGAELCQVPPSGTFYLVFRFLDAGATDVFIGVGGAIVVGRNWNDWGSGWVDIADYGFEYNLMIFAEADCCYEGVQAEDSSLSEIKRLFR
jgi:hypothetical protein